MNSDGKQLFGIRLLSTRCDFAFSGRKKPSDVPSVAIDAVAKPNDYSLGSKAMSSARSVCCALRCTVST